MMMSPEMFLEEYKNASYIELLKLKNELVQNISDFEHDYDMKSPNWRYMPSPDVHYQWDLEVLSALTNMLKEAFNREYEFGEKSMSDYYKDVKKIESKI